jgi:iron complex outermembrane receptor protein
MIQLRTAIAATLASLAVAAHAAETPPASKEPVKTLGVITVTGVRPTSLPTQIPTTMEGVTRDQIDKTINATDSEDALKYFPSLLVRKRYIGDYNHAVLSSRASGTGNSARSAVYADGILLSNYLGNGATYAPRWGLVSPEEIERVDVMYGPFSAAYPGNSVGAVVDYVTRMPTRLEAHAKATFFSQPSFDLYNTSDSYGGNQLSASLGDRRGGFSWSVALNRTDSHGQPLTFATKTVSTGTVGTAGTAVTGAVLEKDRSQNPWYILGTATEYTTVQDQAKVKLAYDFSSTLRATYTFGYWGDDSEGRPVSYLRDGAGNPVYSGLVNINGRSFTVNATDFALTNDDLTHLMHGLSIKRSSGGVFDWEVAASLYDFTKDEQRAPTVALPGAGTGGAGTITDQDGTGWNTMALKGTWRPLALGSTHIIDFGFQQDSYDLRILRNNTTDWLRGGATAFNTDVGGKTVTRSLYAQDTWTIASDWKAVIGARVERWTASDGFTRNSTSTTSYAKRTQTFVSPKFALAYQAAEDSMLKASLGRAVRYPTVNELYGATTGVLTVVNDPTLEPEKSWTSELSLEQHWGPALVRVTGFYEIVKDSLYSERTVVNNAQVTRISNVGKITTPGVEVSVLGSNVFVAGLDLSGSVTYADSRIKENDGFVTVPGDTIGKYQPRVPVWRATGLASYRFNDKWSATLGARYSGTQYSTLDNSDPNGFTYQGGSRYFTMDARVRYQIAGQWSAAIGVDNANNYKYWNFHPYPQATVTAEVKWDL